MIFNKHEVFNGNWKDFKDKLLTIDINCLAEWIRKYALPDNDTISEPEGEDLIEESSPAEDSEHDREFEGLDADSVQEADVETAEDDRSEADRESGPYTTHSRQQLTFLR